MHQGRLVCGSKRAPRKPPQQCRVAPLSCPRRAACCPSRLSRLVLTKQPFYSSDCLESKIVKKMCFLLEANQMASSEVFFSLTMTCEEALSEGVVHLKEVALRQRNGLWVIHRFCFACGVCDEFLHHSCDGRGWTAECVGVSCSFPFHAWCRACFAARLKYICIEECVFEELFILHGTQNKNQEGCGPDKKGAASVEGNKND